MADQTKDSKVSVSDILERRDESRKWMRNNVYGELQEVFRALKCKTKPIMKRDSAGKETAEEDTSRTNVCMPDSNIVWRKNVARLTAQPYRLRYRGGSDPAICEAMSALAMQQYDRSNEHWHDRRIVMMAEAFGFAYSKLYWDRLSRTMEFRKALVRNGAVVYRDRASIMRSQGAPEEEIQQATDQLGPDMQDDELSAFMQKSDNEIVVPTEVSSYEGPCVKSVFIGDLFLEPGCLTVDDSNFVLEQYRETDLWLEKMVKGLKYKDMQTGEMVAAFDPSICQELVALSGDTTQPRLTDDLKMMFENTIGKQTETEVMFPTRLRPRKKFDIIEYHELGDDGRMWITWVSERLKEKPLGRMPYPWNFYGQSAYTELVPLPDMIGPHGDSTPRLMRFLQAMHNRTVAQNFDYVTNLLNKFVLKHVDCEIGDDVVRRGNFRQLEVSDMNGVQVFEEPQLPAGAFEREAQIMRMEATLEPSLNTVDQGTDSNPMAGKLATTAILNAKSSDSLTQFKIDGRDLYLRKLGQKKLWMNQQAAKESWSIEREFWGPELVKRIETMEQQKAQSSSLPQDPETARESLVASMQPPQDPNAPAQDPADVPPQQDAVALSERNGKTVAVTLDPLDIQEDLHVEPEAGSYLSVDDDLRTSAATELAQLAMGAPPGTIDIQKVLRFKLSTIRGIGNPDDYLLPPPSSAPPPPFKGTVSVSIPMDKMPVDIQNQLFTHFGLEPSQELIHNSTLDGVVKMGQAANAAADLSSPAAPDPNEEKIGTPKQATKV